MFPVLICLLQGPRLVKIMIQLRVTLFLPTLCLLAGNWNGTGKWKMWFNKGGAIEFAETMLQAGRLGMFTANCCIKCSKAK